MKVTLRAPWLMADLGRPRRVLSFAPHRPGFVTARMILWRQVRDADLPPGFDAPSWLAGQVQDQDAVAMLTSRDVTRYQVAARGAASCLATVGLGNAERVGHRQPPRAHWGTINIAVNLDMGNLDAGLTDAAMIEALTIIAEARTAAVIDAGLTLPQGAATGTGTDCIALAAHSGEVGYAGLHTPLGQAIGGAVYDAVMAGAAEWIREQQ